MIKKQGCMPCKQFEPTAQQLAEGKNLGFRSIMMETCRWRSATRRSSQRRCSRSSARSRASNSAMSRKNRKDRTTTHST